MSIGYKDYRNWVADSYNQSNEVKLKQLKDAEAKTVASNSALKEEFKETKVELAATKKSLEDQQCDIERLVELTDNLEQYSWKINLEIHGLPNAYHAKENPVLTVAKAKM